MDRGCLNVNVEECVSSRHMHYWSCDMIMIRLDHKFCVFLSLDLELLTTETCFQFLVMHIQCYSLGEGAVSQRTGHEVEATRQRWFVVPTPDAVRLDLTSLCGLPWPWCPLAITFTWSMAATPGELAVVVFPFEALAADSRVTVVPVDSIQKDIYHSPTDNL